MLLMLDKCFQKGLEQTYFSIYFNMVNMQVGQQVKHAYGY